MPDRARIAPSSIKASKIPAIKLRKPCPRQPRTPSNIFDVESDNNGTKLFRSRAKCNVHFDFPSGYDPHKDTGALQCLKLIASSTGTYFKLKRQTNQADSNVWIAEIWGNTDQCRKAHEQLGTFAHRSASRIGNVKKWAKIKSDSAPWASSIEAEHKKLEKEEKLQKYRRDPPEEELTGTKFKHAIVIPWDETEWRVTDELGNHLQAIDDIRMAGQCYIKFLRNSMGSQFLLLGDKFKKITKAATRLQTIPERMFSYHLGRTSLFLLKSVALTAKYSNITVRQIDYFRPQFCLPQQKQLVREPMAGKVLVLQQSQTGDDERDEQDGITYMASIDDLMEQDLGAVFLGIEHALRINSQYLHLWICPALEQLVVYPGLIKMEIHLATCVFQQYKAQDDGYPLRTMEEFLFEANTGANELEVLMASELGNSHIKYEFTHSFNAARDFSPIRSPGCKAVFVFEQDDGRHLRLEAEYSCNDHKEYSLSSRQWICLKSGEIEEPPFFGVHMLDLEHPNLSYGLRIQRCELLTSDQENKLPAIFPMFLDQVAVESDSLSKFGSRIFKFPEAGAHKLLHHEQIQLWRYQIARTGYVIELSLIQHVEYRPSAPGKNGGTMKPWPREPRWGVCVFHEHWQTLFSQNKELGLGKKAKWSPTENQFFPTNGVRTFEDTIGQETIPGAGLMELMGVMKRVEDVIKKAGVAQAPNLENLCIEDSMSHVAEQLPMQNSAVGSSKYLDLLGDIEINPTHKPLVPDMPDIPVHPPRKPKAKKSLRIVPKSRTMTSQQKVSVVNAADRVHSAGHKNLFDNLGVEEA